jgi:hypothetical protein
VPPYLSPVDAAVVVVGLAVVGAGVVGLVVVAAVVVAGLVVEGVLSQATSIKLIAKIRAREITSVFFIYYS